MGSSKSFSKFVGTVQAELEQSCPSIMKGISDISIGFSGENAKGISNPAFKLSPSSMQHAVYASRDSVAQKPYWATPAKSHTSYDIPENVACMVKDSLQASKLAGLSDADAKNKASHLVDTYMSFDSASGKLVFRAVPKGTKDSLLTGTAIPSWNMGLSQKVFKQPFAKSYASDLVSVESFGNAWADVVGVFKETFEGMARVSNVAQGTFEATASDPIVNQTGMILTNIFNIAVDYEIGNEERARAGNAGDFLSGITLADRPRYADMVMNRTADVIRYFGVPEADVIGLVGVNPIVDYAGASFMSILADAGNANKGSTIVQAMYGIIGDFLSGLRYMATSVKINCSTKVFRALTSSLYSDVYNPSSPIKIISDHMLGGFAPIGGASQCAYTITADPMLDDDSPYNTVGAGDDLFIITAPSIGSALEEQTGLVISPEPMERYIVPPMYQRSGFLYTMYKRMGGLITPIKEAVKVYKGVGVQA